MRKFFSRLCFIAALVILIIVAVQYGPKLLDYLNNLITYHDIRDEYTEPRIPETDPDEEEDELARYLRAMGLDPDVYAPIWVDSEGLLEENEDYIGWIYVPETAISYPVVRADDNDEYLHADFHKEYNFAGTIFLDANCEEGLDNHHTILYGHNMRIGTMFAGLNRFTDQDYYYEHPIFWFITPEYYVLYVDFSVCNPSPYDRVQYGIDGYDYMTDEEYADAIETMISSSVVEPRYDVEVTVEDYVMSLSTCTSDSSVRCMVHGLKDHEFSVETNHTFRKETETETDSEYGSEAVSGDSGDAMDAVNEIRNEINETVESEDAGLETASIHGMSESRGTSRPFGLGIGISSGNSVSTGTGQNAVIGHSCGSNTGTNLGLHSILGMSSSYSESRTWTESS